MINIRSIFIFTSTLVLLLIIFLIFNLPQHVRMYLTGVRNGDFEITVINGLDDAICDLKLRENNGFTFWTNNYLSQSELLPGESFKIGKIEAGDYQGKVILCNKSIDPNTHVNKFQIDNTAQSWSVTRSIELN